MNLPNYMQVNTLAHFSLKVCIKQCNTIYCKYTPPKRTSCNNSIGISLQIVKIVIHRLPASTTTATTLILTDLLQFDEINKLYFHSSSCNKLVKLATYNKSLPKCANKLCSSQLVEKFESNNFLTTCYKLVGNIRLVQSHSDIRAQL